MRTGVSLHIGVDYIDAKAYQQRIPPLDVCSNDALSMAEIARSLKYSQVISIVNEEATYENITTQIAAFSKILKADDIFFLTFSGHGFFTEDLDGDEADQKDEGWCLYDKKILDDTLYELWMQFTKDVRILVVSDSCYSGTVIRDHQSSILKPSATSKKNDLDCTVKLLASSIESDVSYASTTNSLFTKEVLNIWDNGQFTGNYSDFYRAILFQMPSNQSPIHYTIGRKNAFFEKNAPFRI